MDLIGVSLCAACCMLPMVGLLSNLGTLTFLSTFLGIAGIGTMFIAIVFFILYLVRGLCVQR